MIRNEEVSTNNAHILKKLYIVRKVSRPTQNDCIHRKKTHLKTLLTIMILLYINIQIIEDIILLRHFYKTNVDIRVGVRVC